MSKKIKWCGVDYSQGVCQDGAAIIKNGLMMTIEEILSDLGRIAELEAELEAVKKITRDKYKNANEVFGLDLGKEVER